MKRLKKWVLKAKQGSDLFIMHTGIISFCDRIGFNIKCPDTKEVILDYLEQCYKIRIIQKHWHAFEDTHYQIIQRSPHLASIRSNGNPYYLYFTRYEGVNQMMYIDKKIQPGYQKPRIILSKGRFYDAVFENTLVEGEMVKDNRNQWLFLITDVIIYKGVVLHDVLLHERLQKAYELLQYYYTPDPIMDVCQFQVKKYVPVNRQALESLVAFSEKLPYSSRGIYIYPLSLKYKPKLINFDDTLVKSVVRKVKDTAGYMEMPVEKESEMLPPIPISVPVPVKVKVTKPAPAAPATATATAPVAPVAPVAAAAPAIPPPELLETLELLLRKTDQPDVYDIMSPESNGQKMGVAAVPSLQTSKMLRNVFKNINVATSVKFVCRLDPVFNNWVPLRKA